MFDVDLVQVRSATATVRRTRRVCQRDIVATIAIATLDTVITQHLVVLGSTDASQTTEVAEITQCALQQVQELSHVNAKQDTSAATVTIAC